MSSLCAGTRFPSLQQRYAEFAQQFSQTAQRQSHHIEIVALDPAFLSTYHEKLMEHHIYTVKVNKGIRVGLCSLSEKTASGLAEAMKKVAEEI